MEVVMARGFESKAVDSQRQDAEAREEQRRRPQKSNAELEREQKRSSLQLQRTRVANELSTATSELYRRNLTAALAYLDEQLAKL
jgi:hypothetical protein